MFILRMNRFLLKAELADGSSVEVHVPDPGRLRELLYPGNRILILPAPAAAARKTRWSLLGARDQTGWILVNTGFHRRISEKLFAGSFSPFGKAGTIRAEVRSPSGGSRFDFLLDGNLWVEVKGCTLKKGSLAMFPDAPTTRGRKHVDELAEMARSGLRTAVVFLVFVRGVDRFTPNGDTDPGFARSIEKAAAAGVMVRCVQLSFDGRRVEYTGELPFSPGREPLCPQ